MCSAPLALDALAVTFWPIEHVESTAVRTESLLFGCSAKEISPK